MLSQLLILVLLLLPSLSLLVYHLARHHDPKTRRKSAIILVLGDVGRSPRMMYHAQSLMREGYEVTLVGYKGTPPLASLETSKAVTIHYIPPPPKPLETMRLPFLIAGPIKVLFQVYAMLRILMTYPRGLGAEVLLVQNPPSIPTLAIAHIVSFARGSKLIIDWHNTGHSILALKLGQNHVLVRIARWFEQTFGRRAGCHLFVTEAMKRALSKKWKLEGDKVVLHDRPPEHFRRSNPEEIHELFARLIPTLEPPLPAGFARADLLTVQTPETGAIQMRPGRPALVVSSTSWTPDEDFGVLLAALDEYAADETRPALVVLVSGKGGALRRDFEDTVREREASGRWRNVTARTTWLAMRDYPIFLGAADLGVCLHSSSSGLDLPMKVVDLFGCEVPVLARGFQCIGELVKEGENGRIFYSATELARQLADTLRGFPDAPDLRKLRAYFEADSTARDWKSWDQQWREAVRPVLAKKEQ